MTIAEFHKEKFDHHKMMGTTFNGKGLMKLYRLQKRSEAEARQAEERQRAEERRRGEEFTREHAGKGPTMDDLVNALTKQGPLILVAEDFLGRLDKRRN